MPNERKTENIVRTHLHSDELYKNGKVIIDEQSSDNTKINKLLANASKSGSGKGYPEFIIQYHENANLVIVIECKPDIKKHESSDRKKYKDYAVDGVLLYASFLSKEYDVIAIAVSGKDKNSLLISHFLQLKGAQEAHEIFNDDAFLSLEDYLSGYQKDERKFNQDFQNLLKYSKTLNDKLHALKVKESERSLLISGILIALTDKAFKESYKYESPEALTILLLSKIDEKLSSVKTPHISDIITSYSFIKTHTILSKEKGKLKNIIDEVDEKINGFNKTHKYFDTLGQFYIEFLRYANNDKGLGIVLTPPHITELFCDIANINKNSVVLDTCTGTGGFLISAMQKMIIDAGNDRKKEKIIKERQIVGVEIQHDIYALLCSNMYIHGDGRSNLIKSDCFSNNVKKQIEKFKPNVGFLNPPYKANKNDIHELQFILNNLKYLSKGSYCIAIIPIARLLSAKGKDLEFKKLLLKEHTLDAVFTMPGDLFHNSKVKVTTCVVVLKAKEKHPKNYKTYFGYWKYDGFSKRKASGRADYENRWTNIKREYLQNYRNREDKAGESVRQTVAASDEWCAEVFMETSYRDLDDNYFGKIILDYLSFLLVNFKKNKITSKSVQGRNIGLDDVDWEYFNVASLFKIESGKGGNIYDLDTTKRKHPYVSSISTNNGVVDFINADSFDMHKKNTLTINRTGSTGEVFYHSYDYVASKDRIRVLIPKFNMNAYHAMFLIGVLGLEKYRFNYGRTWGTQRIKDTLIKLPTKDDGEPDWQFMEDYIKSLPYSSNL